MITQKEIRKLFTYDEHTGILKRKSDGIIINDSTTIAGKGYSAHRLIWCGVHGYFPEHDINHINGNLTDNRLCNLKEVSRHCNIRNSKLARNNTSGVKGVSFICACRKWTAYITVRGKHHNLGYYKYLDDAVMARYQAEKELNWSSCGQESSAFKYLSEKGII